TAGRSARRGSHPQLPAPDERILEQKELRKQRDTDRIPRIVEGTFASFCCLLFNRSEPPWWAQPTLHSITKHSRRQKRQEPWLPVAFAARFWKFRPRRIGRRGGKGRATCCRGPTRISPGWSAS